MQELDEINALACWEWQLAGFNGIELLLIGGGDLSYSHTAEIRLANVHYIDCPARLMHPHFRHASEWEISVLAGKVNIDQQSLCIAIEAETTSSNQPLTFFIVAERLYWSRKTSSFTT